MQFFAIYFVASHQFCFRNRKNTADMSISNNGIPLQEGPNEFGGSFRLKVDRQDLGCSRRLKRNETVGGVELFDEQEAPLGSEVATMFPSERKRGSVELGQEEAERGQGPSKALCCDEDFGIPSVGPHSAAIEEDLREVGETSEKKAEIHQEVSVTCLLKNSSVEDELVTSNPSLEEVIGSQLGEASLAGKNSDVREDDVISAEQDNIFEEGQTGTTSSSQQGASFTVALLNRFPSIDGEDEEEVNAADRGGVEEEAGELRERWSTAEASSEPDQVWYRWVLL